MADLFESALDWLASDTIAARLVGLAFVLAAGVIVAFLGRALLTRLMRRLLGDVGERYPEAGVGSGRTRRLAVSVFPQTVFWLVLAVSVVLGMQKLAGLPLFETWSGRLARQLPDMLTAVVIALAGIWAGTIAREATMRVGTRRRWRHVRAPAMVAQVVITAVAVIIAVNQLGVDLSFVTVVLGIALGAVLIGASLAFGLGANAMAGNIIACHYVQQIYRVGSIVEIDDYRGTIVNITGAFVVIETAAGRVCVPASRFSNAPSTLVTTHPHESDP